MITAWRLAAPEYARTVEEMMSGEGALRFGGRWNRPGRPAVYLGSSLALAGMELLVHLMTSDVLRTYRKMPVFIPERLVMHIREEELPNDWSESGLNPVTQDIGDGWLEGAQSAVLQVPSAVVFGETNFIVNPQHPDVRELRAGPVSEFRYDRRLAAPVR